jgi:hypothetical protein
MRADAGESSAAPRLGPENMHPLHQALLSSEPLASSLHFNCPLPLSTVAYNGIPTGPLAAIAYNACAFSLRADKLEHCSIPISIPRPAFPCKEQTRKASEALLFGPDHPQSASIIITSIRFTSSRDHRTHFEWLACR